MRHYKQQRPRHNVRTNQLAPGQQCTMGFGVNKLESYIIEKKAAGEECRPITRRLNNVIWIVYAQFISSVKRSFNSHLLFDSKKRNKEQNSNKTMYFWAAVLLLLLVGKEHPELVGGMPGYICSESKRLNGLIRHDDFLKY